MTAPYRGPSVPFAEFNHRTLAEVDCPQRGSSRRLGYDPDWETLRPKLDMANKRFARAMKALSRGEGKKGAA